MTDQDTQNVCMKAIIDREYDTEPFDIVIAFEFCNFIVYSNCLLRPKKTKKKRKEENKCLSVYMFHLQLSIVEKCR